MILSHFSKEPLVFDPRREYKSKGVPNKPVGFWLSDESEYGWSHWCRENDFQLENLAHETKFEVFSGGVLHLDSATAVREFSSEFLIDDIKIDWNGVRKIYNGLFVSPFFDELTVEFFWYSRWDCSSACIWSLEVARPKYRRMGS